MDYKAFVNCEKSLLVAPAGYGKTHTITECLKHTTGRQLILTHTHAGVASIKEKTKKTPEIKSSQYSVETISSFAQRFVTSFYVGVEMPEQDQGNVYHNFIIEEAVKMFSISPLREILKCSYAGLFVDEYQDCTFQQHQMIMLMADSLSTHILCDPLQKIFNFHGNEEWEFLDYLDHFDNFPSLDEPQRWMQAGACPNLGAALHTLRDKLENSEPISLSELDEGLEVIEIVEREKYEPRSVYNQSIRQLLNSDVLFIDPSSSNESSRERFFKAFPPTKMLEPFDHSIYFSMAKKIDLIQENGVMPVLLEITNSFYGSVGVQKWFNQNGFKNKRDQDESALVDEITELIDNYAPPSSLRPIFRKIYKLADMKCHYLWRLKNLLNACDQSVIMGESVFAAMQAQRSNLRYLGRFLEGKSIGTILLTKGLEFDTVAILDAHKFDCPKHLYVAMTRACKKLVIFTETTTLSPYPATQ